MLLVLLAACDTGDPKPVPRVSVLRLTDAGCFAIMTPDVDVAPELGISECPAEVPPLWFAADDVIEVVSDYGDDVDFAANTAAPPPAITVTVDGNIADVAIPPSPEHRLGDRAFFVSSFVAPATPSIDVRVTSGVNAGFQTEVATVFAIVRPPIALAVAECPTPMCELPAAVGDVHLRASVRGIGPQTIAVHQRIDGLAAPDPVAPFATVVAGTSTIGEVAVPVPAARDGAAWVLSAELGGAPAMLPITLRAPAITAKLTCGTPCTVARNAHVGLTITAPAQIRATQALVTTRIDGVPQLVAAPVALAQVGDQAVGLVTLVAPATAGSWQIDASIAGYPAPAVVASVP